MKSVFSLIVFVFFIASVFYINTTIYNFPAPKAFSGNTIFNPYQNLPDSSYRANFHAHTVAWKSVTNGHNSEKDVFDAYTKRGYDVAGISNYHSISTYGKQFTDLYIPVYEHGYNIFKSHYLAINSPKVSYFDYPLYQLTSHKQKIIENLKENGAMISMAHPKFAGGRSFSDMQHLVGYEFTEVLNHYRVSEEHWDAALSAGRLTWIMGDDDTHDLINEPSFRIWNIIYSEARNPDSLMQSMKRGQNYAIWSHNGLCDNLLNECLVENKTLSICLNAKADSILLKGQNGKVVKRVKNTDEIIYNFSPEDTYVRMVAYNQNSHLYLNPILKTDGKNVPLNATIRPEANFVKTWLFRIVTFFVSLSLLFLIKRIWKIKRSK